MPVIGVKNFIGDRLIQAKNARGFSSATLSDLVQVSQSSICLYEKGKQNPKQEVVESLARVLNVPVGFFFKEITIAKPKSLFYRSMAAATKSSRTMSEAKYEWTLEAVEGYLLRFFDFPSLNLPDIELPADFKRLNSQTIETIATQLREHWTLGTGPISNMVRTLEANGIVVWQTKFEAETQDSFSEYREPHPFVVLSSDKENYFRSRFNAAHELGHIILHRNIDKTTLNKKADFKLIEDQAHLFAGAFLTPATAYYNDLSSISIDTFRALKPRWNVSIAMQIMRTKHLGLISEPEEKRLWINLSRRNWRTSEPLDDSTLPEKPQLINKSVKMLVDEGVKSKEQLKDEMEFSAVDIENIIEERGYINTMADREKPIFKSADRKIIPFPARR